MLAAAKASSGIRGQLDPADLLPPCGSDRPHRLLRTSREPVKPPVPHALAGEGPMTIERGVGWMVPRAGRSPNASTEVDRPSPVDRYTGSSGAKPVREARTPARRHCRSPLVALQLQVRNRGLYATADHIVICRATIPTLGNDARPVPAHHSDG